MLITCLKSIVKNNEKLFDNAKLNGRGLNDKLILAKITKIFILDETMSIALLVLDKPVVELGWVGMSFLEKISEIS